MRIAITTAMFPPDAVGGTENASLALARQLSAQGHQVFVVAGMSKAGAASHAHEPFSVLPVRRLKMKLVGPLLFWWQCFWRIRAVQPQVVHCQNIQMGPVGWLAKKLRRIPYVVWCQGSDVYLPWKCKRLFCRVVLGRASRVLVLTKHMQTTLKAYYAGPATIVPNGIDLALFQKTGQRQGNTLLFVGTLKAVKGVGYLVEAMRTVVENIPGAKLWLVGEGRERLALEAMVRGVGLQDSIVFWGQKNATEVAGLMAAADVFCLPSVSEGFPLVLLEAMAAGLPVIATNITGIPEIIGEEKNGLLVSPKRPTLLAEKIIYLLGHPEATRDMSLRNAAKAKEFSWPVVAAQLLEIYASVTP